MSIHSNSPIVRRKSRKIWVGNVAVGGDAPISIQTMTNTQTEDVAATVAQIKRAQDAGVDASKIPQALAGGRADSAILQEYMGKMADRDFTPTGRIDNMVKDLNGVQDLARSTNTAMPLTAVCAEIHRVFMNAGLGDADNAALMKFYEGPSKGDLS